MTTETVRPLALGQRAPSISFPATDGTTYSLDSFADKKLLVVYFLANHCPYVSAWEDRIIAIAHEYDSRGVGFVAIASNDVAAHPQDGLEENRKRAEEKGYPFPYLFDERQEAARSFGATRTPEVFLFDQERHLRYHGAVDSDFEESAGMENYLREALLRLLSGQEVFQPETPPVGCRLTLKST
jgi:peroxiredoxin